ncbi:thioredoxin domain-containing protein 3 isoform X6 [Neofelis nebulosa]|uniref:thioredoxin domain-containing protein 3 isoform X6 n=1 Tax=Neofelis nebulosa TaxID=61452 RepID=UPI00272B26C1|nr:thioredoxin domain-containing protein 3 isoform X6 [Neofelis nebulosa]
MASKKREIQLQTVVNSQSLWDEMLQNKGLTVIDVYQAWCGPCKAMQPLFRKLKNELNEDELLHFVVAEADNIVTLQSFRDKCEPVFLFSVNGKIIAKIIGANAPLVNQKIINLIDEERKIEAGEMVRPQYHEIVFVDSDAEDGEESPYESAEQLYSIAIIKPDAVIARKSLEIKKKILEAGFVIEIEDKRVLTEQQVRDFYSRIADQPDFEDFVLFMTNGLSHILVISQGNEEQPAWEETEPNPETETKVYEDNHHEVAPPTLRKEKRYSGPSLALVLLRDNCLQHWKELIGPSSVEKAKTSVPESLCVQFAMEGLPINQLYGSDSLETAEKEIQYFFPPQQTLALIKPHVTQEQREEILKYIKEVGFEITQMKEMLLNEEAADKIYSKIKTKDFYKDVLEVLSEGPSLVMILTKWNAVSDWRRLMGPVDPDEAKLLSPDSIRAQFGTSVLKNAVHGSSNIQEAMETIDQMFEVLVPENPEGN